MDVIVYTVEGGSASDAFFTMDPSEAEAYAKDTQGVVIANEYEYADCRQVEGWDYRTDDDPTKDE